MRWFVCFQSADVCSQSLRELFQITSKLDLLAMNRYAKQLAETVFLNIFSTPNDLTNYFLLSLSSSLHPLGEISRYNLKTLSLVAPDLTCLDYALCSRVPSRRYFSCAQTANCSKWREEGSVGNGGDGGTAAFHFRASRYSFSWHAVPQSVHYWGALLL